MSARHRDSLPQLEGDIFLTDAGLETWLIFHQGRELREFASFELLDDAEGRELLASYYRPFLALADVHGRGFVLETPTWRSNAVWGRKLGYDADALDAINRAAVDFVVTLRDEVAERVPVVISGNIGPLADGYRDDGTITAAQAREAHAMQVATFAESDCDMLCSLTLTNAAEATGLARAAKERSMPVAIGFTVETDGRLPSGQSLGEAIREVDGGTDGTPLYYVVNCAHPDHFADALGGDETIARRVRGIRANASRMSHAELDACETLDEGDPLELGALYADLARRLPRLAVVGGCCGTDIRHVEQICKRVTAA